MKMKYYVDDTNHYIGGTDGEPLSANEVPFPPEDARQLWNGVDYDSVSQIDLDAEKDAQALEAASSPALESAIEEFSAILTTAGIDVPANIKANITVRIKGKLP